MEGDQQFCPKCGRGQLPLDFVHCPGCGAALSAVPATAKTAPPSAPPKSKVPIGTILGIGAFALLVGLCERAENQKKPTVAQEQGRIAEFNQMRAKVCVSKLASWRNQTFRIEVSGPANAPIIEAFVDPLTWSQMPYDMRGRAAEHLSACAAANATDLSFVTIRHGNTGRELAIYSPKIGYQAKE